MGWGGVKVGRFIKTGVGDISVQQSQVRLFYSCILFFMERELYIHWDVETTLCLFMYLYTVEWNMWRTYERWWITGWLPVRQRVCGGAVGWDTVLQVGTSRVPFPFRSLGSILTHYGPGVDSASNKNEYQEYLLGGKSGRCIGPTTLPASCADFLEILGDWSSNILSWPVFIDNFSFFNR